MGLDPTLTALLGGAAALLGAVVGSFLNVVIARVPHGLSIVRPRSRCPRCETPIRWYDNVPVVSWLALRARCRACGAPISWRYPLVEALGAAAAVAAVWRHGPGPAALAEFAFVALVLALAFIDLDTWLLPNALTWPCIALGLFGGWLGIAPAGALGPAALGAAAGFGGLGLVSSVSTRVLRRSGRLRADEEALGFGDVWLLAALGAFLGIRALLPVLLLASVQGSLVGVVLMALGRSTPGKAAEAPVDPETWVPPRHAIPFGPFLVLGALEWLYGAALLGAAVPALDVFR